MSRTQRGFTMIELMVTVAILAVITAIAVPSLRGFIQRSNAASAANTMLTSFALARSEAIRGNARVTVCPSRNGDNCDGAWADGWIVFLDGDQPLVFDMGRDTIVQVFPAMAADAVFTQTVDLLSFTGSGARDASFTSGVPTGNCFEFIVASNEGARRYVRVSNNGSMRTGEGSCT
jgi:type IV fimbrial biogenesis protein FimT